MGRNGSREDTANTARGAPALVVMVCLATSSFQPHPSSDQSLQH